MSDIFTSEKCSSIMSKVYSKENKSTEQKLIHYFKENGIHGWNRGYKVNGYPDFVFLDKKSQFLLMDAFGTGMIVEILARRIMQSIGKRSENAIWLMITK